MTIPMDVSTSVMTAKYRLINEGAACGCSLPASRPRLWILKQRLLFDKVILILIVFFFCFGHTYELFHFVHRFQNYLVVF